MRSSSTMPVVPLIPAATSTTYPPNALRHSALANPMNATPMAAVSIHPFAGFVDKTFVITEFELRKLRHDFTELVTRALKPALWLLIRSEEHTSELQSLR